MLSELSQEELSAAIDSATDEALNRVAFDGPPVDAVALARELGMVVVWDDRQAGRARRANVGGSDGISSIFVRHDPRPEREQWAVAHEIGESLANRVFRQLGIDPPAAPRPAREQIANAIAGRLLVPRDWFAADGVACGWDLLELKRRYSTASHELIARRMLDYSTPIIVGVYDQNRVIWRKTNVGNRAPKSSQQEIDCRRQAHASGKAVTTDRPQAIRVWPIHEADWKREILRVEMDEFAQGL
ncbi:MAG: ImmA/IrrE family metallo-endopeptidase [Pirellulales bacterium]|nr:ImmA/IrrE family metallo-endopeptidase [Pirellulales bacterium]